MKRYRYTSTDSFTLIVAPMKTIRTKVLGMGTFSNPAGWLIETTGVHAVVLFRIDRPFVDYIHYRFYVSGFWLWSRYWLYRMKRRLIGD